MAFIQNLKEEFSREDFRPIEYPGGFIVHVGRIDLKSYQDFMANKWRQWEIQSKGLRKKQPDEKTMERWQQEGFAHHLIRWEGAKDEAGQEIPCTPENVLQAFADPSKPTEGSMTLGEQFFHDLRQAAANEAAFRAEVLEEQAGK